MTKLGDQSFELYDSSLLISSFCFSDLKFNANQILQIQVVSRPQFIKMGNNYQTFGSDPTSLSKLVDTQSDYKIYQSQSGQEYEKYIVMHDGTQQFQNYYSFRIYNKHSDLVDIVYAGPAQGFIKCTGRNQYQVITERIPYRLESLSSIQSNNSLVILKTALRGFRDIYRKHGIIGIKQTMIGVNSQNKVKIWLNRNFSLNKPQPMPDSFYELNPNDKERQMVHSIFDLIDSKTEHDHFWTDLLRLKEERNPYTFDQALNLVDYFSGANHINISDHVTNIFNKKYFHAQTSEEKIKHVKILSSQKLSNNHISAKQEERSNQLFFHEQKIAKLNRQFAEINNIQFQIPPSSIPLRRPFEEIQSKLIWKSNQLEYQINPITSARPTYLSFNNPPTIENSNINHFPSLLQSNLQPKPQIRFNINIRNNSGTTRPNFTILNKNQGIINSKIATDNTRSKQDFGKSYPSRQNNINSNSSSIRFRDIRTTQSVNVFGLNVGETQIQKEPAVIVGLPIKQEQTQQIIESPIEEFKQLQNQTEKEQIILPPQEKIIQQKHHLSVDPIYQVQVHQISSSSQQTSLHEELSSQVIQQKKLNNINEYQKQYKIILNSQNNHQTENTRAKIEEPIKNIESLKTVINASLVDTREIKRKTTEFRQDNINYYQNNRNGNQSISYRQMRRLLLNEFEN